MTATEIKRDQRGNLVFDDRETNLEDLVRAAEEHFPGVDANEIWFEQPDYNYEYDDLLLGPLPKIGFLEHEDNFGCKIYPYVSLAQVRRQAESLPNCDFTKVRLFWFERELCMSISK